MLTADLAFWPAVALMVAANLRYGPRIKADRLAMQWGLDGKPTWRAPKAVALWNSVACALGMRLLIWAAMEYIPDKVHGPEIGLSLASILMVGAHLWTLRAAMREN